MGLHLKIRKESAAWRPNIRDGRWYWAKITQVEKEEDRGHSNPRYILSCEAEGRKFVWTLAEPVQQSCMGGWAPVYTSDSQPDLYVIDEKRMRLEYGEEGTRSPIYRITVRKKPENKKVHAKRSEKEAAARNAEEDRLFDDADAMIGESEGESGENE